MNSTTDTCAIATTKFNSNLEQQVQDTAPAVVDPIAARLRLNNSWRVREYLSDGELYFQKKLCFKKLKEFKNWLVQQGFTWKNACKFLKLYETFAEFPLEQIEWVDPNTLFQLMQPRYKKLLEQLRSLPKWVDLKVNELMQAFQARRKATKLIGEREPSQNLEKPKSQQRESGWIQVPGGGRAFKLPLLHDEETGMKIVHLMKEKNKTVGQVIKEAIAMLYATLPSASLCAPDYKNYASSEETSNYSYAPIYLNYLSYRRR